MMKLKQEIHKLLTLHKQNKYAHTHTHAHSHAHKEWNMVCPLPIPHISTHVLSQPLPGP